ncbi:unnamed protein product [Pleuronectes platessa]|uniref:Uncharacterized protein n=1 Tax=Pleuronectes platessa TaxID=8262 RepID=A0A9N7V3E3_PLEPL|nr:unnamed protein product [Pleuronectes platessa]
MSCNPVSSENVQWQRWSTWNDVTISQSGLSDCEMGGPTAPRTDWASGTDVWLLVNIRSFNSGLRINNRALGRQTMSSSFCQEDPSEATGVSLTSITWTEHFVLLDEEQEGPPGEKEKPG